jgi:phage-related protein
MLKEHEPKEKARSKAERKWGNADVRKRVKQRQEKPTTVDPDAKPEIAEVISNEGRRDGRVNRFENRFKRDIRKMMDGQARLNLELYAMVLDRRHRKLLAEKLRRLKLAHNIGESNG